MWDLFSSHPFAFMGQKGDTGLADWGQSLEHIHQSLYATPFASEVTWQALPEGTRFLVGNAVLGFLFLQQCCYPDRSEDTEASICTQAHGVVNHSHNLIKGLLQTRGEKCCKKTLNYRVPLHQYFQIRQFIANNQNLILRPLTKIRKYRLNSKNNKGHFVTGFQFWTRGWALSMMETSRTWNLTFLSQTPWLGGHSLKHDSRVLKQYFWPSSFSFTAAVMPSNQIQE